MFALDHIGLIVPSLAKAAALFSALGFTLTRRADHTRTNAEGEVESAGSSQCSIMFPADYIELQEQTGPPGGHILSAAAEKHPGLHIVAIGVSDAAAARTEIVRRGLPAGPVMEWTRPIDEEDRQGLARFAFFGMPYRRENECYLFWVEQRTPDLMRSPRLMAHGNTALSLGQLVVSIPDNEDARDIASRHLAAGAEPFAFDPGCAMVTLGGAMLRFERRSALAGLGLDNESYRGPRVLAFSVRFAQPDLVVAHAMQLGLKVVDWRGRSAINLGPTYEAILIVEPV
jgi:catechol 2,3-dioxygenase-like lactoylglutathione lyase family enzyme